MGTKTFTIPFRQNEKFYEAPATKTVNVEIPSGAMIQSATLTWQANMSNGEFDNIVFNNRVVSPQRQGSADVSGSLIQSGDNTIAVNFRRGWTGNIIGAIESGNLNVSLQVVIYVNVAGQAVDSNGQVIDIGMTEASKPFSIPWYVYVVLAIVAIIVIVVIVQKRADKVAPMLLKAVGIP